MEATEALTTPSFIPSEADPDVVENATLTLFTLNGKAYRVPAKPKPVLALRFLNDLRTVGMELAAAKALPALLGEDVWQELLQEEELEPEHLGAIIGAMEKLMLGGVELGNSSSGR